MPAIRHGGAAAPGPVTPRSDNAPGQGRVEGEQGTADGGDCAILADERKLIATLAARAALHGIELHELGGAWLLLRPRCEPVRLLSLDLVRRHLGQIEADRAIGGRA